MFDSQNQVETKELAETLDVASKSMEGIVQNIGNFLDKVSKTLCQCVSLTRHKHEQMLKLKQLPLCTLQTQEMEMLMSELARVSSNEKASVEDCGVALLKTHSSHVLTYNIDFVITLCFF